MNAIYKIQLILLSCLIFCSCSDYLDKEPDTELTIDMVFDQKQLVERWLGDCYSGIPDPYWGYLHDESWDILADDVTASQRWQQYDWNVLPYLEGNWNTQSSWDGNYWARLPQCIRTSLIFIERAHSIPAEGLTAKEVEYMKAECRFLIAYYYYLLVNTYGPIPFSPGYLTPTEFNLSDLMVGQTPYDEIVEWIDHELLEVSEILPASYSNREKYGRATSIMCLAVRARMLLFAASDLTNGNPDYAGFVNSEGRQLFSNAKDNSKWQKATDACRLLIEKAHAAGHQLYIERNPDGTIDPFGSYQNGFLVSLASANPEILFARPSCNYSSYEDHCTSKLDNGNGGVGVTQELVDAFFMANGLPIEDTHAGYVEEGFSTQDDLRYTMWTDGKPTDDDNMKAITSAGTYNMYCNREPRFYVTVNFHNGWQSRGERHYNMFKGNDNTDNNGTHDAPQSGYLLRKRVNPQTDVLQGLHPYRPGILYRLGEAYLNYIEALNETDGANRNEILEYLNMIRERAGIRPYIIGETTSEAIHVDINDRDAMRKIIRAERRVELCCEGLRYDDLRRWKEAENKLNTQMHGMNYQSDNSEDFFKRTTFLNRIYTKANYWLPIHQTEIDKNPNLIQNPYWK